MRAIVGHVVASHGGLRTRAGGHSWLGTGQTLAQQVQAMTVFSQGIPDASCTAHYGAYGRWRCYLGQYSAPFLEAPTLLLQNQIDEWQGFWNGFFNCKPPPPAAHRLQPHLRSRTLHFIAPPPQGVVPKRLFKSGRSAIGSFMHSRHARLPTRVALARS